MKVNGMTQTQSFRTVKDPRSRATQADLEDQFAFLIKVRDETSKANDAVKLVRSIRTQVADRLAKLPEANRSEFSTSSRALITTIEQAEREIYQTQNRSGQDPLNYPIRLNNKIAALAGVAASTDARPTDQTREVLANLSRQLDAQIAKIRNALRQSLPALNRTLAGSNLPPIVESTAEAPPST
jgi:plasmid stabilization system protein ParE